MSGGPAFTKKSLALTRLTDQGDQSDIPSPIGPTFSQGAFSVAFSEDFDRSTDPSTEG